MTAAAEEQKNDKHYFKLNEFEGPLDLLLFLIRKNEVNIYDIPIADITEQYLSYIEYATKVELEQITDFHLMASTLLYIKSQMLLPVEIDFDEEFEDPRKELVERLIEYQKYKKLTEIMADKEEEAEWVIERKKIQQPLPFDDDEDMWTKIDVWDLLKTFSSMISSISSENIIDLHEEVTVNEKISLINELLELKDEIMFTDLIVREPSSMQIVCAFLAILDAVKMRTVQVFQNRLFGDIKLRRGPGLPEIKEYESET
ncbi:MAG: segregation/condensation protein A [Spirochaetia bacterium]